MALHDFPCLFHFTVVHHSYGNDVAEDDDDDSDCKEDRKTRVSPGGGVVVDNNQFGYMYRLMFRI